MNSDQEWNRLQALYAAMEDGEISQLFLSRKSLTETAREVLTAEYRCRGLNVEATNARVADIGIDGPYVELWAFLDDPIGANEALALLESHEVSADVKPEESEYKRPDSSTVLTWKLYVAKADGARATDLLRKRKGLFPLADSGDFAENFQPDENDLFEVAEFDNPEDAALAESGLRAANIVHRRQDEPHEGTIITTFQVGQNDVDRATEAMESAFTNAPLADEV